MDCNHCIPLQLRARTGVRDYVQQRAIILRYGCLCQGRHILMKTKEIARVLGLNIRSLENAFIRHRRRGFIWKEDTRARPNTRPKKFTPW